MVICNEVSAHFRLEEQGLSSGYIYFGNHTEAISIFVNSDHVVEVSRQSEDGLWNERYSPQPEILEHCIEVFEVVKKQAESRDVGEMALKKAA